MKKIFLCLFLFFGLITACSKQETKETYTFYAMDTFISITFYNTPESKAISKNVEDIYLQYESVADDFSNTYSKLTLYDLNETRECDVQTELKEMIEFGLEMMEETNGYYNPFIGRLSHLWKEALEEGKLVPEETVKAELAIMNNTSIEFDGLHAKLIGEGNIDLGGIAKGYATSKVQEYLDSISCTTYLLNAGSSTIVLGNKNEKEFSVGLSKALATGYFKTLKIKEKAISTSSIKEQHVKIQGIYYSHLLNPKTGYPATEYETLSIIGEDSKVLDAYSTACFAMELEELKEFLNGKGLEYIVSKNNTVLYESIGVKSYA